MKLIGRERLLSLDAYRVMELPYGAISVQLSESPLDIRNNYEKVSALRAAIKQSIDNNIFFDPKLHPPDPHFVGRTTEELKAKMDAWYGAHRYNVPAFDMSDLKAPPLAQEVEVALRGVLEKRGMLTAMTLQEVEPKRFVRFVGFRFWPVQHDLREKGWQQLEKLAGKDLAAHPDAEINYVFHRTDLWLEQRLAAFRDAHPRFQFRGTV